MHKTIFTVLGVILGFTLGFVVSSRMEGALPWHQSAVDARTREWPTYTDTMAGNTAGYTFSYPSDYQVSSQKNGSVHTLTIVPTDAEETGGETPAMKIRIANSADDASIEFSLWEGMAWDYYDEVVESFEVQN